MWDVEGITFSACGFYNWQENLTYSTNINKGILAINAGFRVFGYCNVTPPIGTPCGQQNLTRSVFQGFNIGIHATSSGSANTISIDQTDFNTNVKGIEVNGINNYAVTRCNFSIGGSNKSNLPIYQDGLMSISASGYRIEENIFSQSALPTSLTRGLEILNSGISYNESYKNSFIDLTISQNAGGVNRNGNNTFEGFQFLCNNHQNSGNHDITVTKYNIQSGLDGVRLFQGDPNGSVSAGNLFSQTGPNADSDFLNNSSWPILYYHNGGLSEPLFKSSSVLPTVAMASNNCISRFNNFPNRFPLTNEYKAELENIIQISKLEYLNTLYSYNQLIDGGSTSAVLTEIMTSWPQDAWELRNYLMSFSPYLSIEALDEAARSLLLPNAMLLEISLANPDASRNDEFIAFLQDKPDPMSHNMINMISTNWEILSPRTVLESSLALNHSNYNIASDLLLSDLKLAEEINYIAINNILISNNSISDNFQLIDNYISSGDFQNLNDKLDYLSTNFNLGEHLTQDLMLFENYSQLLQDLSSAARSIAELETNEIDVLREYSSHNSIDLSVYAQSILCFFYDDCKEYSNLLINSGSRYGQNTKENHISSLKKLIISPNPSNEIAIATIKCNEIPHEPKIQIRELTGKILFSEQIQSLNFVLVINTSQFSTGMYIIDLINNDNLIESNKLVIHH